MKIQGMELKIHRIPFDALAGHPHIRKTTIVYQHVFCRRHRGGFSICIEPHFDFRVDIATYEKTLLYFDM